MRRRERIIANRILKYMARRTKPVTAATLAKQTAYPVDRVLPVIDLMESDGHLEVTVRHPLPEEKRVLLTLDGKAHFKSGGYKSKLREIAEPFEILMTFLELVFGILAG